MTAGDSRKRGEEIAAQFNPHGIVPFPFEKIVESVEDLRILYLESLPADISGFIGFSPQFDRFTIAVDSTKPQKRQYFTLAHELGHYYLHNDKIKTSDYKILVDSDQCLDIDGMLFRPDDAPSSVMEREANNFAGALLMPEKNVVEAWSKLQNVDACAKVFGVSVIAMSVRLQILGLTDAA